MVIRNAPNVVVPADPRAPRIRKGSFSVHPARSEFGEHFVQALTDLQNNEGFDVLLYPLKRIGRQNISLIHWGGCCVGIGGFRHIGQGFC